MRRYLMAAIIMVILLTGLAAFASEPRLVKVGAFNYYPAIFKDKDGVVKGFYVDALADIARRENIRFEYVHGSWNEGLERIRSGEVDLLTSVAVTPERTLFMDYAKTPLLTVWGELYVPLASDIDGIRAVQGKKIAVMKGDFNARYFVEMATKFGITCEYVEMPSFDDIFKATAAKTVDAGVVNSTYGAARLKEYGLRSTGVVFNPFDIYFSVAKGKNSDLLFLLDSYLVKWRYQEHSVYNEARQKWSHGNVGTMQIIPRWLFNAGALLVLLIIIAIFFILLLRRQVRRATAAVLQRENSLSKGRERFDQLALQSLTVHWEVDTEGLFTYVSHVSDTVYGYRPEELVGIKHFYDLHPLEGRNEFKAEAFSDFSGKKPFRNFLNPIQTRDGRIIWVTTNGLPLLDDQGNLTGYNGSDTDITERKLIEDTQLFLLQCGSIIPDRTFFESLARYLASCLNVDYVCIDRLQGDGLLATTLAIYHDGEFEDNVAYTLKDTPCGDAAGKKICLFPKDVRHLFPLDTALQELMAESYAGATLWSSNGKPIGLIALIWRQPLKNPHLSEAVLKLVSLRAASELERLQAEEILRESEARFSRLLKMAPLPLSVVDKTGLISYRNDRFIRVFGYTQDDVPTLAEWWRCAYPDTGYRQWVIGRWGEALRSAAEHGGDIEPFECRVTCMDGTERIVEISCIVLGESVLATFIDLTEHKEHEKEQFKIEKLESLGVLAGGIAHDFNNILTGIMGNVTFARMFLDAAHKSYKPLLEAEKASVRAGELAQQLLTFARGGEPIKKLVSVRHVMTEAVSLMLRGSNVKAHIDVSDSVDDIEADEGQISQVFNNIIINATQAMPGGGTLTVNVHNETLPVTNTLALPAGEYIRITFTDEGCGIPEEDRKKIFDPYFSTKAAGNGLGLASAHSIVSRHGGSITVSSQVGKGTSFTIYIPSIGDTCARRHSEDILSTSDIIHTGGSILVMDDEEIIRELTSEILEFLGYQVTTCVDGREAVAHYKAAWDSITPFSAVIMDLTIPGGMGGAEAAEQILAIDPGANLIVSSGYSNGPFMADYKSFGFSAAVAKPYTMDELGQVLSNLLSGSKTVGSGTANQL